MVYAGRVGEAFGIEEGQLATRLCALNVLAHARAALDGDLDRVAAVAYLRGYVNVTPDFDQIAEVVNGASQVMLDVFGPEIGAHCRTAVGAASMPFNGRGRSGGRILPLLTPRAGVAASASGHPSPKGARSQPPAQCGVLLHRLEKENDMRSPPYDDDAVLTVDVSDAENVAYWCARWQVDEGTLREAADHAGAGGCAGGCLRPGREAP